MKVKTTLLFMMLFAAFIFTSCEKSDLTQTDESTPEVWNKEYLEHYIKQAVIFHYSVENKTTGKYSGWVINNSGEIRKYETATKPKVLESIQVSNDDLWELRELATEISSEVEGQAFVDAFEQMDELDRQQFKTAAVSSNDQITTGLYAYQDEVLAIGEHISCLDPNRAPTLMFRVALEKETAAQQTTNVSAGAKVMMQFLTGLKQSID